MRLGLICLILFLTSVVYSQNNLRCIWLKNNQTYFLEKNVLPSTIIFSNHKVYVFDSIQHSIVFNDLGEDSVKVCYRLLPRELTDTLVNYSSGQTFVLETFETHKKRDDKKKEKQNKVITKGSITRGVAVGNGIGNGVDSRLNLEMTGEITNGLWIKAYVSDQDIPIQPEGVTQNVQDLDKIYVQLYTERSGLTMGDIAMSDTLYYLKYSRNLQGISVYHDNKDTLKKGFRVGAGISKGKFASYLLSLRDGVSGPYKILGPQDGKFNPIISGSEKVFLNGKELSRGKDYIMDYNQSLITFMPSILITIYSRVRIDFEYSDLNFFRLNTGFSGVFQTNKIKLNLSYYNEKDNPNKPIFANIGSDALSHLQTIGDQKNLAWLENKRPISDFKTGVWYKQVTQGGDKYFEWTSNIDSAEYELSFSDIGAGNGDYIRTAENTNGVVYKYVGKNNGRYLPVSPIALPHQKQMFSARVLYRLSSNIEFGNEMAISSRDINLYSSLDDNDNEGFSNRFFYSIKGLRSKKYKLIYQGGVEVQNSRFEQIDRFRSVDFDRNWGTNNLIQDGLMLSNHVISLKKNSDNEVKLSGAFLDKKNDVSGYKWGIELAKRYKSFSGRGVYEKRKIQSDKLAVKWEKVNIGLSWRKKSKKISATYIAEHNERNLRGVLSTRQYFDQIKVEWKQGNRMSLSHSYRIDQDTLGLDRIAVNTVSYLSRVDFKVLKTKSTKLSFGLVHRRAEHRFKTENQVQGLIKFKFKKKSYNHTLTYKTGSSQELRREFVFVPVAFGKGSHRFIDFDDNGEQSINEFVEDDIAGDYIKVIIPTNEFIDVFKSELRYNSSWNLKKLNKNIFKYFSGKIVLSASDRNTSIAITERLSPFRSTKSGAYTLKSISTIYFHRSKGWYELYYSLKDYQYLNRFLRGDDRQVRNTHRFGMINRVNKTTFNSYYEVGKTDYKTTISQGNNYQIEMFSIKEELSTVFKKKLSTSISYQYTEKSGVKIPLAQLQTLRFKSRVLLGNSSLLLDLSHISIRHTASSSAENSQESFVLLQGLRKGSNWRWMFSFNKKVYKNINLNISYQGRKPQSQEVYHIGRVQVMASF